MTVTAKLTLPDDGAPVVPAKPKKRRNFAPGLARANEALRNPALEEELDRLGLRWFREECEK